MIFMLSIPNYYFHHFLRFLEDVISPTTRIAEFGKGRRGKNLPGINADLKTPKIEHMLEI